MQPSLAVAEPVTARSPALRAKAALPSSRRWRVWHRLRRHRLALVGLGFLGLLVLCAVGLGAKLALVPLHSWLPVAHPAAPAAEDEFFMVPKVVE